MPPSIPPPRSRVGLDLTTIRIVLAVAEHGGIRSGADAVGYGVAAVSQRVRSLEEALGVSLFHRRADGVEPTQAGEAFLREARLSLRALDVAVARAEAAGRGEIGQLTLGLHTSISTGRLRAALEACHKAHPVIQLRIIETERSGLIEGLSSGRMDMIVLIGEPDPLIAAPLPLWRERIHVGLPATDPLAAKDTIRWAELADCPFLVSTLNAGSEAEAQVMAALAGPGKRPAITLMQASRESIQSLIGLGWGVTIFLESAIGATLPDVVFRPLEGENSIAPLVAYSDQGNDNPSLTRFRALLRDRFAEPW
jgi:DNA-binding transcriptional LysR family regulator